MNLDVHSKPVKREPRYDDSSVHPVGSLGWAMDNSFAVRCLVALLALTLPFAIMGVSNVL